MNMHLLVGTLGLVSGFLSGLLGIGGGIVMAPLLLYVPPWLGLPAFSMREVAGLTIIQGLTACLSGVLVHRKFHFVSGRLAAWMGSTIFVAALTGGAAADRIANQLLLAVFAILALAAAVLILVPTAEDSERPNVEQVTFSRLRAVTIAGGVGFLGGLVGQGGSFILIPLMTSFLQIPTRIAIGSNLAIILLSSLAAFLGKALTGQILWSLVPALVLAVVPATFAGGQLSRRLPVGKLRLLLAVCIAVAAIRISLSALTFCLE
ncbi:hypothetical protein EDC39_109110 [Geothermobacter ehrlichii]|uniref:Probable membrane transporter protein n=1 Tax=Geothermobacter ehrlichii TaxID=213224 RepID=A0A5D3WHZ2_9BACT|nr:sulfite exporter TauE/SafE family protein [Geothermobacter ehrlichii]TYO97706.1 hypothetical protein EDC39_109110 [Geothermobacter ehrlichii]